MERDGDPILPTAGAEPEPTPGHLPPADYEGYLLDAERTLDAVDEALGRIGDGTYGTCEACGEPIPDAELEVSPVARWCSLHLPLADAT